MTYHEIKDWLSQNKDHPKYQEVKDEMELIDSLPKGISLSEDEDAIEMMKIMQYNLRSAKAACASLDHINKILAPCFSLLN